MDLSVACYHDDTSDYSSQTSDVWSFSSTFVNEFRFSFNRQGSFLTPYSLGSGIPAAIDLQYAKADIFPNLSITGNICCDSPYAGTNTIYAQNVYQPSDVVTLIRGKHVLHFGGELIMLEDNSTAWGNVNSGSFNFSGSTPRRVWRRVAAAQVGPTFCLAMCRAGRPIIHPCLAVAKKVRKSLFRMTSSSVTISP